MAKYWKKEIPKNPIQFSIGRAIPFEYIDYDYGYYATDNGWEIIELNKAAMNGSGGVSEISKDEYDAWLKKKASAPSLSALPRQRQQIVPQAKRNGPSRVADPAATSILGATTSGTPVTGVVKPQRSEGLKIDREFVKPRTGKIPNSV